MSMISDIDWLWWAADFLISYFCAKLLWVAFSLEEEKKTDAKKY